MAGMMQTYAETALVSVVFVAGNVTETRDGATAAGLACRTDPVAGILFPAGSEVDLYISLGPDTGTDNTPPLVAVSASPEIVQPDETVSIVWSCRKRNGEMGGNGGRGNGGQAPITVSMIDTGSGNTIVSTYDANKMWGQTQGGGFMGIPTYFLMELRQHIVVIRFSDGELLKFKMKVLPDNSLVFPVGKLSLSAGFVPMDTTKGTLEALDFDSKHLLLLFGQLYEYGSRLYDPKRFKYTNLEGTEYIIHTEKGIESITDVHGHKLTYDEAGITHSSDASIVFERGLGNRIDSVKDHFGNVVTYTYGDDGTLQTAKLQRVDSPFERQLGGYHSIRGFIHLVRRDDRRLYNWVNTKTRIEIRYPW